MYELLISSQGQVLGRVQLTDGVIEIGRDASCDVVLEDECVSRNHARLLVIGDRVLVEDLASGNGTFVNDEPVTKRELRVGDRVFIEPFQLEVSSDLEETHPGVSFGREFTPTHGEIILPITEPTELWRQPRVQIVAGALALFLIFIGWVALRPNENAESIQLSSAQRLMLDNAVQALSDARAHNQSQQHEDALRAYEQTIRNAQRPELAGIRDAEDLLHTASREAALVHELLASQRVRDSMAADLAAEKARKERTAAEQARFEKSLSTAQATLRRAYSTAEAKPSVSSWQAVESAARVVINLKPRDEFAQRRRTQARAFLAEHHKMEVLHLVARGQELSESRDAAKLHVALTLLQRARDLDPDGAVSNSTKPLINNVGDTLRSLAAPHVKRGDQEVERGDYLRARTAYEQAVRIDRTDKAAQKKLAQVERECMQRAETLMKQAKIERSANNDAKARKTCEQLFEYDRDPQGRYHAKCEQMIRAIERQP